MRYREPTRADVKKYAPLDAGTIRNRHNKTARGMSKTAARGRHNSSSMDSCILALMVRGTTDKLRGIQNYTTRGSCDRCGQKDPHKLQLNDGGRARLWRLRNEKI